MVFREWVENLFFYQGGVFDSTCLRRRWVIVIGLMMIAITMAPLGLGYSLLTSGSDELTWVLAYALGVSMGIISIVTLTGVGVICYGIYGTLQNKKSF